MKPGRSFRSEEGRGDSSEQLFPILASETARNGAAHSHPHHSHSATNAKNGDEKISLFWRVFGGTILSISALVVISAYQGLSGGIHDLRTDLARANEAHAEFVKKDEYANIRTKIWDKIDEVQKNAATAAAPIDPMKLRIEKLESDDRAFDMERREIHELHATLKERLSQIEGQLTQTKGMQKDLQSLQQTIVGMQDKLAYRDQQLKQADDERKELTKELQALRERVAKVEATKDSRSAPAKPMRDEDNP